MVREFGMEYGSGAGQENVRSKAKELTDTLPYASHCHRSLIGRMARHNNSLPNSQCPFCTNGQNLLCGFKPLNRDRLAQLVEYRTTVRAVVGSSPGRTNPQGL